MVALPGLVDVGFASVTGAGRPPYRVVSGQHWSWPIQGAYLLPERPLPFAPGVRAWGFFFPFLRAVAVLFLHAISFVRRQPVTQAVSR